MPKWVENMLWISEAFTFPIVILILVVAVLFLFRKELAVRIQHSSFKVGNLAVSAPHQSEPPAVPGTYVRPEPDTPPEPDTTPEIERREHRLERENAELREHALRQALAESQWETYFERTYRSIYSSQMRALNDLNPTGAVLTQDALRKYMPLVLPISGTTFEQWFQFLVNSGLVMVQGQGVVISEVGRRFLLYVTQQGYPQSGHYPQW